MRAAEIASALWMRRAVVIPTSALIMYFLLLVVSTHVPPIGWRQYGFALKFKAPDKLAHATAYAGLTFLSLAVWRIHRPVGMSLRQKCVSLLGICCLIACWGLVDEFTQPFFGRQFDWFDWLANLVGMSLAVATTALIPSTTRTWWLTAFSLR